MTSSAALRIGIACLGTSLLAGCDFFAPQDPDPWPRIEIYEDRFVYRDASYASISALDIALTTANRQPKLVRVRECGARDRLEPVLELIRQRGWLADLEIALPEEC